MKYEIGNIISKIGRGEVVCVTTNGFVKRNGEVVMGRGIALQIQRRYPSVPKHLGSLIRKHGNRPMIIGTIRQKTKLVSFPVKHNWWEDADLQLIEDSCIKLVAMADKFGWEEVILPRPGCGNGNLEWEQVYPILSKYFDDRFVIMSYNEEDFKMPNIDFEVIRDDINYCGCGTLLYPAPIATGWCDECDRRIEEYSEGLRELDCLPGDL